MLELLFNSWRTLNIAVLVESALNEADQPLVTDRSNFYYDTRCQRDQLVRLRMIVKM